MIERYIKRLTEEKFGVKLKKTKYGWTIHSARLAAYGPDYFSLKTDKLFYSISSCSLWLEEQSMKREEELEEEE